MSESTSQWYQVEATQPIPAAPWLTPGVPVWAARLDPADLYGKQWYVVTSNGDNETTVRLPASWVRSHISVLDRTERPPASVLDALEEIRAKSTMRVLDYLLDRKAI